MIDQERLDGIDDFCLEHWNERGCHHFKVQYFTSMAYGQQHILVTCLKCEKRRLKLFRKLEHMRWVD